MLLASPQQAKLSDRDMLRQDGLCVFKNALTHEQIKNLSLEINKIREKVMAKISTMARPLATYSDIAERHLGRLDYRCGFNADIFQQVAEPISALIKQLSPLIDFKYYWGVITSLGGSGPTNWHRDVYPIVNTREGEDLCSYDLNLPPYYLTVLIPLIKLTTQNGPTGFIKGSHTKETVVVDQEEIYAPLLSPGDITIFDGRTLHCGFPNTTQDERLIAYLTFTAQWYHDQTFVLNRYLFPESL